MGIQDFLEDVWATQPAGWGFVSVRDEAHWRDVPLDFDGSSISTGDADRLEDLDYEQDGLDVYFTPNTFSKPTRRAEYVNESSWLYADLDLVDPYGLAEDLTPTIAWQSSPGRYQAMWWMSQLLPPEIHGRVCKGLTYKIHADKSGWHATKVLRVPGTRNYKYESRPQVFLLWDHLHKIQSAAIRSVAIPKAIDGSTDMRASGATQGIVAPLPVGVQGKLRAIEATGDRSKVLWRLVKTMLEKGWNEEQVFWAVRRTPWNKFDTDALLRAEIRRAAVRS